MSQSTLGELLAKTELFADLSPELVKAVAKVTEFREYKPGSKIVRQGDEGSELFIIASGSVNVLIEDYALWTEQVVLSLEAGQSFGESSLLTKERRSATVQAKEDTVCAVLSAANFERVLLNVPQVALTVSRYLAKRLAAQCRLTGFRFVGADELVYDPRTYRAFPESVLRQCEAIPIGIQGRTVTVALTRPNDVQAIKRLQKEVPGLGIEPVACTSEDYETFIKRFRTRSAGNLENGSPGSLKLTYADGEKVPAPLSTILQALLGQGSEHCVIDSEPSNDQPLVKREGYLQPLCPPLAAPDNAELRRELTRLLEGNDTSANQRAVAIKVNGQGHTLSLTALRGYQRDRYSLHLAHSRRQGPPLSGLFPSPQTLNLVRGALAERGRTILLTGQKGSGLSTTLQAMVEAQARSGDPRNILLLERGPIVSHEQIISCRLGESLDDLLTVAELQRPDLIAVDGATPHHVAQLLLHPISEPTVVMTYRGSDLLDQLFRLSQSEGGRAPYLHRVRLILEQRLVRKICNECRGPAKLGPAYLERLYESKLDNQEGRYFQGAGCSHCGNTGVDGVTPIFEAINCSRQLLESLAGQRRTQDDRERALRESLSFSFRSFSRLLISQGVIDPLEGLRMFGPSTP